MTDHCMRTPAAARYLGIAESTLNKTRLTGEGPSFVKAGPRAVAYREQTSMHGSRPVCAGQHRTRRRRRRRPGL